MPGARVQRLHGGRVSLAGTSTGKCSTRHWKIRVGVCFEVGIGIQVGVGLRLAFSLSSSAIPLGLHMECHDMPPT